MAKRVDTSSARHESTRSAAVSASLASGPSDLGSALAGAGVLVTRPRQQGAALARKIEASGGRAVLWPALEILPPRDTASLARLPERLGEADWAVLISPNAVERAVAAAPPPWPARLLIAVVGQGTARALRDHLGRGPDLCPPTRFDSEGLLALAPMQQVGGKRVLIVRGEGGRELLADTLRQRGAAVEYVEVYRRAPPHAAPTEAAEALAKGAVDIVTATSSESLRNLLQMAGDLADTLRSLPLIVVSERMGRDANEWGFRLPARVARGASDEALLEALLAWASGRER